MQDNEASFFVYMYLYKYKYKYKCETHYWTTLLRDGGIGEAIVRLGALYICIFTNTNTNAKQYWTLSLEVEVAWQLADNRRRCAGQ